MSSTSNAPVALITGASSGIGKSLAKKLAAQRYSLVLVARDETALDEISRDLVKQYGTAVEVIAQDLLMPNAAENIFEALNCSTRLSAGTSIDLLILNAGFGIHGAFAETDLQREEELVNLQILSLLRMTKVFIPSMIQRRSGKILNVASVYSYAPVPFQAVYSASKAFLLSFSESLDCELKPHGITVSVLCPGSTQTEFRKRAGIGEKKTASGMSPDEVADIAVRGLEAGHKIIVPGFLNQIFVGVAKHLSGPAMARLMIKINQKRGVNPSSH